MAAGLGLEATGIDAAPAAIATPTLARVPHPFTAVRVESSQQVRGRSALSRTAADRRERPRTEGFGARYGASPIRRGADCRQWWRGPAAVDLVKIARRSVP